MQVGSLPPQPPAPPVGYVSSTMVSDLETDLPDEEEEDDEEEDEGYGARHPRGLEHTPGSSMDNLDSSVTGKPARNQPAERAFNANMLTARSSIKFLKRTLGYYNYRLQQEIRKSMNFKQDSEREIKKRKGRHGKRSRFNWRQSRAPPVSFRGDLK